MKTIVFIKNLRIDLTIVLTISTLSAPPLLSHWLSQVGKLLLKSIGDLADFQQQPVASDQGLAFEDIDCGDDSDSGLEDLTTIPTHGV